MEVRPLNEQRWALAVVLTVAGLLLALTFDLRLGWAVFALAQALLLLECLSRLGLWPSRDDA
jgi:hypothetical protein